MRTRPLLPAALAAAAVIALAAPARAADAADGKEVFLAQKCNLCHSVSGAGIEATTSNEKLKGPDLSSAPRHDADFLEAYLQQEETLDGKKHKKKYNGSEGDFDVLIAWLREQAEGGGG